MQLYGKVAMENNTRMNSRPNLTDSDRNAILQFLLKSHKGDKQRRGAIFDAAEQFQASTRTVSRIWKRAKESYMEGSKYADVRSRKPGRSGARPENIDSQLDLIPEAPLRRRGTLRCLSHAIDMPLTSLWRALKNDKIKRISSAVKPALTEENKKERLKFAMSLIRPNGFFENMRDQIHIDEK
eukprot:Plantae.Rhodophyta-Hildenbrandia_rubra.ctg11989.p1 GENE.Plantae.Rhodophyta-Hildenbrandia_rubra.ctg11989~~Plantae.Rhodophyta-Hildenbrandia_rubra.ctg11989.p1  ORF type:complete len:183 (+),score=24.38 Plantae.Rhodophyta-Hildenbrandia_rubra.ctg11989:1-549(+)